MTRRGIACFRLAAALGLVGAVGLAASAAQEKGKPGQDMEARIAAYKKAAAVTESHKLLEAFAGDWTTTTKTYMNPAGPPMESAGTASGHMIFGGRFVHLQHKGTMMEEAFEGILTAGYDNQKKKYVSTWIDSMSTSFTFGEGTYDAGTKTFTFAGEMDDAATGGRTKFRFLYRIADKDRITFEWYDNSSGKEAKEMESIYTRKK